MQHANQVHPTRSGPRYDTPDRHAKRDPHLWVEIVIILILLLSLSLLFAEAVH